MIIAVYITELIIIRMLKYNKEQIVKEYLQGKTTKQLALELGTYNTTIRRILLRNGVVPRNQSEAQSKIGNPFLNLDDENVQYWLGMLASDGTIGDKEYVISLGLQEKDFEHVVKYSEFLKVPVKSVFNKKFNCIEYRVGFKNKACNLFLRNLGITPRKSKTLKMNINLNPNFIRGIIDGDGFIRKNTGGVEIATQSVEFKGQLVEWFTQNNIHCTNHYNGTVHIVGIYSKKDLITLYNLIYKNASVYLERKYNRLYASLFGNN